MRFIAAGLSFMAACALAQSPPETRNHRALSLLFLRFLPAQPPLNPGKSELTLSYVNANDFRQAAGGSALDEDYEISRFAARLRTAFKRGEIFVELPIVVRGPGYMDELIDWWHRTILNYKRQPRDFVADGRSRLFSFGEYDEGSAFGLGDATVGLRQDYGSWAFRLAVEVPFGDSSLMLGNGSLDVGVCVDKGWILCDDWAAAAQLGAILQGSFLDSRDLALQGSLTLIWLKNSKDEWSLQWQAESPAFKDGSEGSDGPHTLLTLGYRRILGDGRVLRFYVSENSDILSDQAPALAGVGPDFTFGVSLTVGR